MTTTVVGIREITRHTSEVIHRAAAGETVIITERDEPIAMLVPLTRTGDPAVDRLIRDGTLAPASNPGGLTALLATTAPYASPGAPVDAAEVVSEQREDRL